MKTVLILLTGFIATQGGILHGEEWHKHWDVGAKPELLVTAGDASVRVEGGSDRGIDATITTRGWSIGDNGVRIVEHQNGNRVELDVKLPETHFSWGNHSIQVVVQVPSELFADVHTSDGSITLTDLTGSMRANSSDGSIEAHHLDGNLEAHASDGSVHVSGRFDNLNLHTSDGSIDVEILKGSRVNADWRIQTGDGSVEARFPKDLNANLELRTGDGRINLGIPLSVTGLQSEHGVQGKLNAGGGSVVIRTGDGSISVGAS